MVNNLFRFCMYNELSFSFLNGTCGEIHEISLVNHIIYEKLFTRAISFRPETRKGRAGCFILRGTSETSSILLALRSD